MDSGRLHINLQAFEQNWHALNAKTSSIVGAVVKADAYGLEVVNIAMSLAKLSIPHLYVATAQEGAKLRQILSRDHPKYQPSIFIFSGHMAGQSGTLKSFDLIPLINSLEQFERQHTALPKHAFGVQLNTGMNRLGLEPEDWDRISPKIMLSPPTLIMSHLACADDPESTMNAQQLACFETMTKGLDAPRSLSATGGLLLGQKYHFDHCRPGIGLYGGAPFDDAIPVISLDLPVVQTRVIKAGETVGYGQSWTTPKETKVATLSGGYADGLIRMLSNRGTVFWHQETPCPLLGRVSMDLITADISALDHDPEWLTVIGPQQTIDQLAAPAQTIGYEILTSLSSRYHRITSP